jgi:hypothetical protein
MDSEHTEIIIFLQLEHTTVIHYSLWFLSLLAHILFFEAESLSMVQQAVEETLSWSMFGRLCRIGFMELYAFAEYAE